MIADDLTGATDTAAAFAQAGFRAVVVLARRAPPPPADVLVLSTDSRHDTPRVARRKAIAACHWLQRQQAPVLYKKMDSTLQGNIVSEVGAIRDTLGFAAALVCPANPAQGRKIRRSHLTVRGKPWGSLLEQFAAQGLREVASVCLPFAARTVDRALLRAPFVLADAASTKHLSTLAAAGLRGFPRVLLAGSAGLAAALANVLAGRFRSGRFSVRKATPNAERAPSDLAALPALILCGSTNAVTAGQLQALIRKGVARESQLAARSITTVRQTLLEGLSAIVHVPVHRRPEADLLRELRGLGPLLRERRVGRLLATGGDTALLVCGWLKPAAIAVAGEIVPGLAWGWCVGGLAAGLPFCTKPGGFGDATSMLTIGTGARVDRTPWL